MIFFVQITSKFGDDPNFDTDLFEMGWVQPSTRSMLDSFLNDSNKCEIF